MLRVATSGIPRPLSSFAAGGSCGPVCNSGHGGGLLFPLAGRLPGGRAAHPARAVAATSPPRSGAPTDRPRPPRGRPPSPRGCAHRARHAWPWTAPGRGRPCRAWPVAAAGRPPRPRPPALSQRPPERPVQGPGARVQARPLLHLLRAKEATEGKLRGDVASRCPGDELRHVHTPIPGFAVVDPALRLPQALAQLPLRETSLFPQRPQEPRQPLVRRRVLGL